MIKKPIVIFLNGGSSSGKTTLSHALQEKLEPPFLHIGIDKIISMMPHKHNDWVNSYESAPTHHKEGFWFESKKNNNAETEHELKMGPLGKNISLLLVDIVETMLQSGHNLIIDEVVTDHKFFNTWKERLKEYPTLFIGLTCNRNILEQRERERGNRMIGSALQQSKVIHLNKEYDLMIETSDKTTHELAHSIITHLIDHSFF